MLSILKRTFRDFSDDECPVRAAALAYYTVFALPPLLVLLIMVAGALWDPQDVQRAMETQFASLVGQQGATAIHGMIQSADRPGSGGLLASVISIAMLLFGATGAFLQLQGALNRAWEVKPDPGSGGLRNFVMKRVLSLGMILGIAFLLIVSLAISALIGAIGDSLTFIPQPVMYAVNFAISFAVLTVLFAAIFKVLPDAKIAWRYVWIGAAATALLFVIGKFAIGLYLGRSSPGDAFGAASALAVILVWVYYAGMIVLFGAEFTQAWAQSHGARIEPEKGAVRFDRAVARSSPEGRNEKEAPRPRDVARREPNVSEGATTASRAAQHESKPPRRHHMERTELRDLRRGTATGGNGADRSVPALAPDQSVGELFRQLTTDSSHLVRQEINLAKVELKETGKSLGQAGARLGIAVGVAIPGLLALTAFLIIGLGDLMNENYWLSALIVGLAFLGVAAVLAKRARAALKNGLGIPETAGTLREDAQWAKEEAREFKRQFTA
jgi:membrane protein